MDSHNVFLIVSALLCICCLSLFITNRRLHKKIEALTNHHQAYVFKQMVDLRTICHNINTPINNIMTVFDVFKMELYGTLPPDYVVFAKATEQTINDLRQNIKDIQQYCDSYSDIHKISVSDIQANQNLKLTNPYIIHE